MLMYAGLNSLNFSIVENRRSVPVPFRGGSTSNEKCLLPSALLSISLMFIFVDVLIILKTLCFHLFYFFTVLQA